MSEKRIGVYFKICQLTGMVHKVMKLCRLDHPLMLWLVVSLVDLLSVLLDDIVVRLAGCLLHAFKTWLTCGWMTICCCLISWLYCFERHLMIYLFAFA